MQGKSTLKLIVSEISAIGINIVPLALWLFEDYSAITTMVLYALESLVALILAALCVFLLAPVKETTDYGSTLRRSKIIAETLLTAGGWALALLGFLFAFIFIALKTPISLSEIKFGMLCIAAFQLFEFFGNLYLLRPLSVKEGSLLLGRAFGGLVLLHISLILGIFFALFVTEWFVLPFIVFRTIIDVATPILYYMGKYDDPKEYETFRKTLRLNRYKK